MAGLPTQQMEIYDFSGGMTDNILQGDPRRGQDYENLFITADKKLMGRPGFVPLGLNDVGYSTNWILPSGNSRVTSLHAVHEEDLLMAQSGSALYLLSHDHFFGTGWITPVAFGGNPPVRLGESYSQISVSEFNKKIYFVGDGGQAFQGSTPGKLFQDDTNTWVACTVGLPKAYGVSYHTSQSLVSECISLANALRTSFLGHMKNQGGLNTAGTTPGFLHRQLDKWSESYFESVSTWQLSLDQEYPGPVPTPIPAPDATSEATLYDLVAALALAYNHHSADMMATTPKYHNNIAVTTAAGAIIKGPTVTLQNTIKPVNITEAADRLNDIYQKWFWHRFAVFGHERTNAYGQINKYAPTVGKISDISIGRTAPLVTPDYSDLFAFVNALYYAFDWHVSISGGYVHSQQTHPSQYQRLTIPVCTDLDSAYLAIYWMRALYGGLHQPDATVSIHRNISFTATTGSPSITAISGGVSPIPPGVWIYCASNMFDGKAAGIIGTSTNNIARVVSSNLATAVLDRPVLSGGAGKIGQYSTSYQHISTVSGVLTDTTAFVTEPETALVTAANTVGASLGEWGELAQEFFYAFVIHGESTSSHTQAFSWENTLINMALTGYTTPAITGRAIFVPTISSVAYAFVWKHQYTVEDGGLEYLVQSNPVFTESLTVGKSLLVGSTVASAEPDIYQDAVVTTAVTNVLSNLPVLTNSDGYNYAVSDVVLQIYRTTDGGTTFYLLDEVANGTSSYQDSTPDDAANPGQFPLNTREVIYTSGGVVGYDQPPLAKYIHSFNETTFYAGITDSGQFFGNRLLQGVPGTPDAAPATFYLDLKESITALSSTKSGLVVGCNRSIYRVSGGFNTLGQGLLVGDKISDTVGVLHSKGMVQTEVGIFFAGTDGFYHTDGYQLIKISLEIDKTYFRNTMTAEQKDRIIGAYDRANRRVFWTMQSTETGPGSDCIFVFYLNFGVKPSGVFTTIKNGDDFNPSCICFNEEHMFYGDEDGHIFWMDPTAKADYVHSNIVYGSAWKIQAIPYKYTSCAFDSGSLVKRKYITKIHLVGPNEGNQFIQVDSIQDVDQTKTKSLAPVSYNVNPTWGNPRIGWLSSGSAAYNPSPIPWKYDGMLDLSRRFPASSFRSDVRQIQMQPKDGVVYSSFMGERSNPTDTKPGMLELGVRTIYCGVTPIYFKNANTGVGSGSIYTANSAKTLCMRFQPDGKLLVGGTFSEWDGVACGGLVRLNVDGTLDTSFVSALGTGFWSTVSSLVRVFAIDVHPTSGEILVGGQFNQLNGLACHQGMESLLSTGAVNTAFNPGFSGFAIGAIITQAKYHVLDSSIMVLGTFFSYNGAVCTPGIIKIFAAGGMDGTFQANVGTGFAANSAQGITILASGEMIVGGSFTGFDFTASAIGLVKLAMDGTPDGLFEGLSNFQFFGGRPSGTSPFFALEQSDGKIVLIGGFTKYGLAARGQITRISSDGVEDAAYYAAITPGITGIDSVYGAVMQSDNSVVIVGQFTAVGATSSTAGVMRISSAGVVDTAFLTNLGAGVAVVPAGPTSLCLDISPAQALAFGGAATKFNGAQNPGFIGVTVLYPNGLPANGPLVTLNQNSTFTALTWPLDIVGYYVSFAIDNYLAKYLVTGLPAADLLSIEDLTGTLPTSTVPSTTYIVSGKAKNQRLALSGYILSYASLGEEGEVYPGAKVTDGPGNAGVPNT